MKHTALLTPTVKKLILYRLPLVAWMAAIFAVSSLTPGEIARAAEPARPLSSLISDAAAHTFEFGVMAVLVYRLLRSYEVRAAPYLWAGVLAITALYGASDELHQSFVPGRDPSLLDVASDAAGAVIGLLAAEVGARTWRRFRPGRR